MRLTKIVATLGPASSSPEVISQMIRAGVDVFRLNFSHGSHQTHLDALSTVRAQAEEAARHVAVIQDLCGPKIRVGPLKTSPVQLETASTVTIRSGGEPGDASSFGSTYPELVDDLEVGSSVLIDDGKLELVVLERRDDAAVCRVNVGGELRSGAGINLPGVKISSPSVTEKDLKDLMWGIEHDVDYVALSFVRSADDISVVKRLLHDHDRDIPVIAKIEKPEALEHIEAIIDVADAIMVARGDLGVEMRLEVVPTIQKRIIALCRNARKPVITATQMLQSMTTESSPTRAEVSDVANAILDGSDAVMLSGETAVGRYPVQSVHAMARIAAEADRYAAEHEHFRTRMKLDPEAPVSSSLTHSVAELVSTLHPALVVVSTASGYTACNLSKEELPVPVLALSDSDRTCRRMALMRGTVPELARGDVTLDAIAAHAAATIHKLKLAQKGQLFVMVAGFPVGRSGTTNTVQVRRLEGSPRSTQAQPSAARWTHADVNYRIDYSVCIDCGSCMRQCPHGVFVIESGRLVINEENLKRCIRDRRCVLHCPTGAIAIVEQTDSQPEENSEK